MDINSETKIRIVIADDQEIIRKGVAQMLLQDPKFEITGVATNGEEAIQLVHQTKPDILIVDILMPILNGFDVVKQLKSEKDTNTKIIIASAFDDLEHIETAMQYGADGYLSKDISYSDLNTAVHEVCDGRRVFSQTIINLLNRNELGIHKNEDFVTISNREQEILNLLAQGKTSNQIAEELFISVRTVQVHRSNILKKLGIKTAAGLVRYAVLNYHTK